MIRKPVRQPNIFKFRAANLVEAATASTYTETDVDGVVTQRRFITPNVFYLHRPSTEVMTRPLLGHHAGKVLPVFGDLGTSLEIWAPFRKPIGKKIGTLVYDGNKWVCDVVTKPFGPGPDCKMVLWLGYPKKPAVYANDHDLYPSLVGYLENPDGDRIALRSTKLGKDLVHTSDLSYISIIADTPEYEATEEEYQIDFSGILLDKQGGPRTITISYERRGAAKPPFYGGNQWQGTVENYGSVQKRYPTDGWFLIGVTDDWMGIYTSHATIWRTEDDSEWDPVVKTIVVHENELASSIAAKIGSVGLGACTVYRNLNDNNLYFRMSYNGITFRNLSISGGLSIIEDLTSTQNYPTSYTEGAVTEDFSRYNYNMTQYLTHHLTLKLAGNKTPFGWIELGHDPLPNDLGGPNKTYLATQFPDFNGDGPWVGSHPEIVGYDPVTKITIDLTESDVRGTPYGGPFPQVTVQRCWADYDSNVSLTLDRYASSNLGLTTATRDSMDVATTIVNNQYVNGNVVSNTTSKIKLRNPHTYSNLALYPGSVANQSPNGSVTITKIKDGLIVPKGDFLDKDWMNTFPAYLHRSINGFNLTINSMTGTGIASGSLADAIRGFLVGKTFTLKATPYNNPFGARIPVTNPTNSGVGAYTYMATAVATVNVNAYRTQGSTAVYAGFQYEVTLNFELSYLPVLYTIGQGANPTIDAVNVRVGMVSHRTANMTGTAGSAPSNSYSWSSILNTWVFGGINLSGHTAVSGWSSIRFQPSQSLYSARTSITTSGGSISAVMVPIE